MTDTDTLSAALHDNAKALQAARADAELYARLAAAKGEVARLQRLGSELTAKFSAAQDSEAKAARTARRAQFRNLSITTSFPPHGGEGATTAIFTIKWEGPRWDYHTNATDWGGFEITGFNALIANKPDVFAWIMEFHSTSLPSPILNFAPGDPETAMEHYLLCLKRGWESPLVQEPATSELVVH